MVGRLPGRGDGARVPLIRPCCTYRLTERSPTWKEAGDVRLACAVLDGADNPFT
jgi:hypothetical protein